MKNEKETLTRAFAISLAAKRANEKLEDKTRKKKSHKKEGKELCKWIDENNLQEIFTKTEKKIIYSRFIKKEILQWYAFGLNAVQMLLWAIGLSDITQPIYVNLEKNGMRADISALKALEKQAKLRDEREIEKICNIAMLWHWRSIEGCLSLFDTEDIKQLIDRVFGDEELTKLMDEMPKGENGHDFWIEEIPNPIGQEKPIKNCSFNCLRNIEMQRIQCTMEWKQKALEWVLCDDDWDDVSADT